MQPAPSFIADPADRQPHGPPDRARLKSAALLALSCICNLAVLGVLFHAAYDEALKEAPAVEIPIEIVPEPPPPPQAEPTPQPETQKPQPQPQTDALDEKPATDAPRAANREKTDHETADEETKGPRTGPRAEQAATRPKPEPQTQARSQPETRPDAEPLNEAGAAEARPSPPQARVEPDKPASNGDLSSKEMLAAFGPAPEFEFSGAQRESPVAGGHARSTYLTVLYGLIRPHMRVPLGVGPHRGTGVVVFMVDGWGGIARIGVMRSSGAQDLDAAAVAAVRSAAPFPPPPNHRALGLNFTYGAK